MFRTGRNAAMCVSATGYPSALPLWAIANVAVLRVGSIAVIATGSAPGIAPTATSTVGQHTDPADFHQRRPDIELALIDAVHTQVLLLSIRTALAGPVQRESRTYGLTRQASVGNP